MNEMYVKLIMKVSFLGGYSKHFLKTWGKNLSSRSYNPRKFQLYDTSQKISPENLQANHKKLMNVKNGAKPCRKPHLPRHHMHFTWCSSARGKRVKTLSCINMASAYLTVSQLFLVSGFLRTFHMNSQSCTSKWTWIILSKTDPDMPLYCSLRGCWCVTRGKPDK